MNYNFQDYSLVIFDLDNTLYDENIYLFRAYEEIAFYLSQKYAHVLEYEINHFLKNEFLKNGRESLLNKLFIAFDINDELKNCLKIMRTVQFQQKITLTNRGKVLVEKAISQSKVIILTNGNPMQQKNKIKQIDWGNFSKDIEVIYANEYEPKPSSKVFEDYISKSYNVQSEKVLMIGDNIVDEEFAKGIGCSFINIVNL